MGDSVELTLLQGERGEREKSDGILSGKIKRNDGDRKWENIGRK